MIKMTMEAESFDVLVKNLCDMLDKMGALQVAEVQKNYRLTLKMMQDKMAEFDAEFGYLQALRLLKQRHHVYTLSEFPLSDWHEFFKFMTDELENRRFEQQTDDLLKELAW